MRKVTIVLALALALALLVGTFGCSSNGADDEQEVRDLIEGQVAALNEVDLETVYNHKTPSYRSRVTAEEYEGFILVAYADFLPQVQSGAVEVFIADVEVRVEGEWAYITGKLGVDGTVLLEYTDEAPDIWQKIDGKWYDVEENPLFPGYDPSELPD